MTQRQAQQTEAPQPVPEAADIGPHADDRTPRRASLEAVAVSGAVALGWALMASTHPTTTYHFAPVVAVAVLTFYVRARVEQPVPFRIGLNLSAAGALIALITTAVIENLDAPQGPTLWGPGSALAETLVAITAGFLIGLTATMSRRKWPGRGSPCVSGADRRSGSARSFRRPRLRCPACFASAGWGS